MHCSARKCAKVDAGSRTLKDAINEALAMVQMFRTLIICLAARSVRIHIR